MTGNHKKWQRITEQDRKKKELTENTKKDTEIIKQ